MQFIKTTKVILVGGWAIAGFFWLASVSLSSPANYVEKANAPAPFANNNPQNYVGSETCKQCHEDHYNKFARTAHAKLKDAGWKEEKQGCEACHGAGKAHVDAGGDKSLIRTFANDSQKQISDTCLKCHSGKEDHNNYIRGTHYRNDVGCTQCHSPHGELHISPAEPAKFRSDTAPVKDESLQVKMLKNDQPQLCFECHNETKSAFTMPFHHRVLEGAMKCNDCHNPHGGFEQKQTRLAVGGDIACIKCHTDKQGPFVYEHAPLKVEGCTYCHNPHGASNPKMLKRNQINQLCIECHTNTEEIGAPNTPSFHNQATLRFQNCTTCHAKIHGSNSHPFFFR